MECNECRNLEREIEEMQRNYEHVHNQGGVYAADAQRLLQDIGDLKKALTDHKNSPFCRVQPIR